MLDVEVALVEALASEGLIPASCIAAVRDAARAELYEPEALALAAAQAGNMAIPLVEMLTAKVASADPAAARYVHWGTTSQDIIDTGLVLQIRAAVPSIQTDLQRAAAGAIALARLHADTPQVGRTWLQHATPITFGLKAAGWADALGRSRMRLAEAFDGALVLQFGGAAGTLAALGGRGIAVAEALGARLDLRVPELPWHAHRDRLVNLATALGIAAGTLGKIARDLALLAQTEVNEAHEAPADGRGRSSAMPQKRNPVAASLALAAAVRAPGLVSTMLAAMPQEHERGLGGWQAEWDTLPELIERGRRIRGRDGACARNPGRASPGDGGEPRAHRRARQRGSGVDRARGTGRDATGARDRGVGLRYRERVGENARRGVEGGRGRHGAPHSGRGRRAAGAGSLPRHGEGVRGARSPSFRAGAVADP